MAINTNGLTPIDFGGSTWTNDGESPIVGDRDIRGGLRYLSGSTTIGDEDRLEDIGRRRLQDGMLVYVKNTYTATLPWSGGVTAREIEGDTYYKYEAGTAVRDSQGRLPNGTANWVEFEVGGGGIDAWDSATAYNPGDVIYYTTNNRIYMVLVTLRSLLAQFQQLLLAGKSYLLLTLRLICKQYLALATVLMTYVLLAWGIPQQTVMLSINSMLITHLGIPQAVV